MEGSGGTDSKETEEYEDDFEKDLEWLINEKEKSDVSIIEVYINAKSLHNNDVNWVLCNSWEVSCYLI